MSCVGVACSNAWFVFVLICVSEWKENVSNASCWDSLSRNYESFMFNSEIRFLFAAARIVNRFDIIVMIVRTRRDEPTLCAGNEMVFHFPEPDQ